MPVLETIAAVLVIATSAAGLIAVVHGPNYHGHDQCSIRQFDQWRKVFAQQRSK